MRELLAGSAASLHPPFAKADVVEWFTRNYPGVAEATISTQMAGLTVGNRPHAHLAAFPPVPERVGRGLYRKVPGVGVSPGRPRTARVGSVPSPSVTIPPATVGTTVLLLGCVKSKADVALPGRDRYTGALFGRRRAYAERSGHPWYILSARWGLVDPVEVIAPYDVYLPAMSITYRAAWGEFVVAQLAEVTRLAGCTVEIHAGDAYVSALRTPLLRAGAVVVDAVDARSFGETLAWYDTARAATVAVAGPVLSPAPSGRRGVIVADIPVGPALVVVDESAVEGVVRHLGDGAAAMSAEYLDYADPCAYATPGMYGWWVDAGGAQELSSGGLGHHVAPGLIYAAGQAGATRWPSGRASTNSLWARVIGMHLGSNANLSTFRLTLAAVLQSGSLSLDESALTTWMRRHLSVIVLPIADGDAVDAIETGVLARLDSPLNLAKRPVTPLRGELTRLRKHFR